MYYPQERKMKMMYIYKRLKESEYDACITRKTREIYNEQRFEMRKNKDTNRKRKRKE